MRSFSQPAREQASKEGQREHNELYHEWYDWLKSAWQMNTESALGSGSAGGCSRHTVMVERMPFLSFNGDHENWAEFKRVFKN